MKTDILPTPCCKVRLLTNENSSIFDERVPSCAQKLTAWQSKLADFVLTPASPLHEPYPSEPKLRIKKRKEVALLGGMVSYPDDRDPSCGSLGLQLCGRLRKRKHFKFRITCSVASAQGPANLRPPSKEANRRRNPPKWSVSVPLARFQACLRQVPRAAP